MTTTDPLLTSIASRRIQTVTVYQPIMGVRTSTALLGTLLLCFVIAFAVASETEKPKDSETCNADNKESCGCHQSRDKDSKKKDADDTKADDKKPKFYEHVEGDTPYKRTNQMVRIPGGTYTMGTDKQVFVADGEGPQRQVKVDPFYLDKYEVSNAEFELFINQTGYKTEVRERERERGPTLCSWKEKKKNV